MDSLSTTKSERNRRKKENAKKKKEDAKAQETQEKELLDKMSKSFSRQSRVGHVSEVARQNSTAKSAGLENGTFTDYCVPGLEIKKSPGKGLGVFTTRMINVEASYAIASKEKKARFMALHSHCNCGKKPCVETPVMKIWDVNSFEAGEMTLLKSTGRRSYVYAFATRINHSCVPNIIRGFTRDIHAQIVFHALQDIKPGEELYTDYVGSYGNTLTRRRKLSSKYGFYCRCKACANNQVNEFDPKKFEEDLLRSFPATTPDLTVVGKQSPDEITKAGEVDTWYKEWLAKLHVLENCFEKIFIVGFPFVGGTSAERRTELLSKALAVIEKDLKSHNKFGLSDNALDKFMARERLQLDVVATKLLKEYRHAISNPGP